MSARMVVDGRIKYSNVSTLFDSSPEPVIVGANDLEIGFSEVMIIVTCMLHDRRFALTRAS